MMGHLALEEKKQHFCLFFQLCFTCGSPGQPPQLFQVRLFSVELCLMDTERTQGSPEDSLWCSVLCWSKGDTGSWLVAFCWVCMSQGTGTGQRNGPSGSLGPLRGCSGTRKVRGSGRNCCSAPDGEKKKENYHWQKYIPRLWCPQMSPKWWEIFHFLYLIFAANTTRAFNIYFHSRPHALFRKSEYTRTQTFGDNIGSRGARFSHHLEEKKMCLKYLSDCFKTDSNPLSVCRLHAVSLTFLLISGKMWNV